MAAILYVGVAELGSGSLKDLALALFVGMAAGTYSSIYIASALVLWWHKGQRPVMASSAVVVDPTVAPARANA